MKRLFISVLALTISAFAFVSCDKDDDNPSKEKAERGSYLSLQEQQDLFTDAFIKSGEQVQFEGLGESVRNIIYSFAGRPLNVDSAYAQIRKDREAARKMDELRKVENVSDLNLDELYFGVDLILNEAIINGDTMMVAEVQKINHNVDRFIINITSKGHTLSTYLKVSAAEKGSVEVNTSTKEGVTDVKTVYLPSLVSFAVQMDGKTVLGADLNISTDYLIKIIVSTIEEEDKLESVTFNGNKLDMNGEVSVGDCSFMGKISYAEKAGINVGAAAKANGFEIFGIDLNVKTVISNDMNYANTGNLLGLAMNGIKGLNANARLGGDAIVFKAEYASNPIQHIMMIAGANETDMPAIVDTLNKAFSFDVYFKGKKEPQAKFEFAFKPVPESEKIQSDEDDDMLQMMVATIANSGLTMIVKTHDDEGKEITVPALEYFGKIDLAQFAQGMTDKFNAAFAETLAPLFGTDAESFDLTDILKKIIFNSIADRQENDIITEG